MLATHIWMVICTRGLYKWWQNARSAHKNRVALESNGRDPLAINFARVDNISDNLRATAFFGFLVVGVLAEALGYHWIRPTPTFVRFYGDAFQAIFVYAAFIFAFNGELYGWVTNKVLRRREDNDLLALEQEHAAAREAVAKKNKPAAKRKTPTKRRK